jgi:DNA-binding NtrC family response regulator
MSSPVRDPAEVATDAAPRPTAGALNAVRRLFAFWDGGNALHPLNSRGMVSVGRSRECDIRIDHSSVSRVHFALHLGARIEIEDLGSGNGTWVNGARLEPKQPAPLQQGDVIEAGRVVLLVQEGRTTAPPAGAPGLEGEMDRVTRLVELVAPSAISVLLLGETGVGKDVTARAIHAKSPRAARPFISINCAALPEALLESELFGHERGAFTGAVAAKAGLLESASGGTVFLNEVGELPLSVQAKLLSALETHEAMRVGGVQARRFDVRFIAATNRDLERAVVAGEFRQDLFFRLNGITIRIPPLRERLDEIPSLSATFLAEISAGRAMPVGLSPQAYDALRAHSWPGNVRELRSLIERAALLATDGLIRPAHFDFGPALSCAPSDRSPLSAEGGPLRQEMSALERQRIEEVLEACGGNQTQAAKLLGMSRRTLVKRLGEYALLRRDRRA